MPKSPDKYTKEAIKKGAQPGFEEIFPKFKLPEELPKPTVSEHTIKKAREKWIKEHAD